MAQAIESFSATGSRIRRGIDATLSFFLGEDVFISYGRKDAFEYAANLADKLSTELSLSVAIDQRGAPAGLAVPSVLLLRCRLARMLVVVGSKHACESIQVGKELANFPVTERPVVAIDIAGAMDAAIWAERIPGTAKTFEREEALAGGAPSAEVIKRVQTSTRFIRRETVQNRVMTVVGVMTLALLLAAAYLGWRVNEARTELAGVQGKLAEVNVRMQTASKQLRATELQAAEAERATRSELGRSASMLAAEPGHEREAAVAGLRAIAPGKWFKNAPPPAATKGVADAAAAIWYSLPLEDVTSGVKAAAFTQDGSLLLAENATGDLAWSTISGKRVPFPAQDAAVLHSGALPWDQDDAHHKLDRSGDAPVLKDSVTGAVIATLTGYQGRLAHYAFSRDHSGALLAIGSDGGTLQVWDTRTGKLFATLAGHSKEPYFERFRALDQPLQGALLQKTGGAIYRYNNIGINSVAFSPRDPTLLISGANDRSAMIWDLRFPASPAHVLGGHELAVNYADFSPSGRYALSASEDGAVRLWTADGRPLAELRAHHSQVTVTAFTSDESRLATFARDGTARIWRPTHDDSFRTLDDGSGPLERVAVSADGKYIVASSQVDRFARLWNRHTGKLIARLRSPSINESRPDEADALGLVHSNANPHNPAGEPFRYGYPYLDRLANGAPEGNTRFTSDAGPVFSRDGRRLLTQSGNRVVCWDTTGWKEVSRFEQHQEILSAAAFSPDGSLVVSSDNAGNTFLWRAASGSLVAKIDVQGTVARGTVTSAQFSPDGNTFALSSYGGGVTIWAATTGRKLLALDIQNDVASSIQYSRDGQSVLVAERGFAWRIHNSRTGAVERSAAGPEADWAGFSPDGRLVLTTSAQNATLWTVDPPRVVAQLRGHSGQISAAAFSADGKRIVTASWDETLRLWDGESGEAIATLHGHLGRVNGMKISADDSFFATASMDGTVRLFPAGVNQLIARAREALGGSRASP